MTDTTFDPPQSWLQKTNAGTALLASILTSVLVVIGVVVTFVNYQAQVTNNSKEIEQLRQRTATKEELQEMRNSINRIDTNVENIKTYLLTNANGRNKERDR